MSILNGIGAVLTKIMDWTPNRKEKRRNDIEKIKEKMDEILKGSSTDKSKRKYVKLSERLKKLERDARND